MTRTKEWLITVGTAIFCVTLFIWLGSVTDCSCEGTAYGQDNHADSFQMANAICDFTNQLAKRYHMSPDRCHEWATRIISADQEYGLDEPWLLAAIVRRESAYRWSIDHARIRGKRGEIGAVQIHPTSGWRHFRPMDCKGMNWEQIAYRPRCSFRTGVAMIKHMFDTCPGSTWRKLASYHEGKCVSERVARTERSAVNAKNILCKMRPDDCDHLWTYQ